MKFIFIIYENLLKKRKSEERKKYIKISNRVDVDFGNMYDAVEHTLDKESIYTRKQLDEWCGGKGREPFYTEVRKVSRTIWKLYHDPKKYIRAIYEGMLPGYTNARVK
jgi:hypothetical protein